MFIKTSTCLTGCHIQLRLSAGTQFISLKSIRENSSLMLSENNERIMGWGRGRLIEEI